MLLLLECYLMSRNLSVARRERTCETQGQVYNLAALKPGQVYLTWQELSYDLIHQCQCTVDLARAWSIDCENAMDYPNKKVTSRVSG